ITTHGTKEPYQHPFEAAMSAVVPLSKNQQNCDNIAWPGLIAQKREPRDHAIRGGGLRTQHGVLYAADRLADGLAVAHLNVAANDGADRNSLHLPAVPWRGLVFAVQLGCIDGRFLVHVENGDVAVGAQATGALPGIDLPHPRRLLARHLDVLIEAHAALVHLGEDQGNAGLNAAEAGNAVPDRGLAQLAVGVADLLFSG